MILSTKNFDGLILSYQNSIVSQEQTAQAIFGGVEINGTLPVNTKHYRINSGIETRLIRMRYVLPYDIGFNDSSLYKIDSIIADAIFNGCLLYTSDAADE